ncbi:hypothetical protein [Latilactobacillus curvatus]|uniref:hypothetical protein n=1 Tax=Latilactobacillus curvatus TaxID=28038 RepID=UPI00280A5E9B|nr:hypothetical protein [Latilactobacillus curvatus]
MLKTKVNSISVNAKIKVGDVEVVEIYKTINADGSYGDAAQTIVDTELYAANMTQCREDRQKFESMCLNIQDKLIGGSLLDEYLKDKEE